MNELEKLRKENKILMETCEVLSNSKVMHDIKDSLKEISQGEYYKISDL
ncbi:MAG: hypothetical protein ACOCXG_01370 [Nanoarchaeota archaeon]